jgi:hypothetical protein
MGREKTGLYQNDDGRIGMAFPPKSKPPGIPDGLQL